jgi:hypothetical protein
LNLQPSKGAELVYGVYRNDELVFIPKQQAFELAQLREALTTAKTWGEFKAKVPAHLYKETVYLYSDYEEDDEDGEEPEAPGDKDEFVADDIPGHGDGDWPIWAAQAMLEWVPQDVQERFGRVAATRLSGEYLYLPENRADEIASAMQSHGYTCVRDDALVERAEGYS